MGRSGGRIVSARGVVPTLVGTAARGKTVYPDSVIKQCRTPRFCSEFPGQRQSREAQASTTIPGLPAWPTVLMVWDVGKNETALLHTPHLAEQTRTS